MPVDLFAAAAEPPHQIGGQFAEHDHLQLGGRQGRRNAPPQLAGACGRCSISGPGQGEHVAGADPVGIAMLGQRQRLVERRRRHVLHHVGIDFGRKDVLDVKVRIGLVARRRLGQPDETSDRRCRMPNDWMFRATVAMRPPREKTGCRVYKQNRGFGQQRFFAHLRASVPCGSEMRRLTRRRRSRSPAD